MLQGLVAGATAVAFLVGAVLALTHRGQPGTRAYVALMVLNAVMALALLGTAIDRVADETAARGSLFCWFLSTSVWATFAIEYTGRGPVMTRRRTAGIVGLAACTATMSIAPGILEVTNQALTLLVFPLQVAVLSLSVFGVFLVARSGITYDDLPLGRSVSLSVAGTSLTVIFTAPVLVEVIGVDRGIRLATGILAVSAAAFLVGQLAFDVLDGEPSTGHLARERLLDEMSQAVFLIDRERQLLDVNETAVETFGVERPLEQGQTLESTLGESPDAADSGPVTLETRAGNREFEWRRSELTRGGDTVGTIHALRDVTERRTDEQRLAVLNRVLRHNLRNDLDAIRAFAETLEAADSGQVAPETVASRIETTARDVASIGDTVEGAEQLLQGDGVDRQRVDIVELADRIVNRQLAAYPDGSGSVSGTAEPISTDPRILETVLAELVENALKHGGEPPSVTVTVREDGSGLDVAVRDDGPGIPEHEQAVLLEGEETPLNHGSGLGLWLVYWGVKRLGGTLSFDTGTADGSTVVVSIPSFEGT